MKAFREPRFDDQPELLTLKEEVNGAWVAAPNAPKFKEFVMGVGWLDPQGQDHFAANWALVLGVQEDGRYAAITESTGIEDFAKKLVALKDTYLVQRIFAEQTEQTEDQIRELRWKPGLCFYKGYRDKAGKWKHTGNDTPTFRDYQTVASVTGVEGVEATAAAVMERLRGLVKSTDLIVRNDCPRFQWILRQRAPFNRVFRHPLFKAVTAAFRFMPAPFDEEKYVERKPYVNLT